MFSALVAFRHEHPRVRLSESASEESRIPLGRLRSRRHEALRVEAVVPLDEVRAEAAKGRQVTGRRLPDGQHLAAHSATPVKQLFDTLVSLMARRIVRSLVLLSIIAGGGLYWYQTSRPAPIVLTGVVTTHDVIVSPQVTGRLTELLVEEGDTVAANAVLARLDANELTQDRAFYAATALSVGSQVQESAAALRFQERLVGDQVAQAEATLAATESQIAAAQAELDNAQRTAQRADDMARQGVVATEDLDRARTARDVAQAKLASLRKQVDAARSAVALARTNAEQIAIRKSQLDASVQQRAAATAQRAKADVRLAYTELRAPEIGRAHV